MWYLIFAESLSRLCQCQCQCQKWIYIAHSPSKPLIMYALYGVNVCDCEGIVVGWLKMSPERSVIDMSLIVTTTPCVASSSHRTPTTAACCVIRRPILTLSLVSRISWSRAWNPHDSTSVLMLQHSWSKHWRNLSVLVSQPLPPNTDWRLALCADVARATTTSSSSSWRIETAVVRCDDSPPCPRSSALCHVCLQLVVVPSPICCRPIRVFSRTSRRSATSTYNSFIGSRALA